MRDVAEQLRRYGEAVEEMAMASPGLAHPHPEPRRRGRHVLVVAGALGLVMVGSLAVWAARDGTPSAEVRTSVPPTAEPRGPGTPASVSSDMGGLILYGGVPLSTRHDSAVVATGDLVVVWGGGIEGPNFGRPELGDATFSDGAFLDLASGTWHPMAPSPLPAAEDTRPVGIWTGDEVLIFRGSSGGAWDPTTDTWTDLPPAPGRVTRAFWTGDEVIALGADATFRLGDGGWSDLPAGPFPPTSLLDGTAVAGVWTGSELLIVNKSMGDVVQVAAYDPDRRSWRSLPDGKLSFGSMAIGAAWTGGDLVVIGYDNDVAALDLQTRQWRALDPLPVVPQESVPRLVAVEETIVAHQGPGVSVLSGGGWTVFPVDQFPFGAPEPGPGGTVLTFGLTDAEGSILGVFDPRRAVADPKRLQIGFSSLQLDDSETLRSMSSRNEEGARTPITATITTPEGDCTVTDVGAQQPPAVECPSEVTSEKLRSQLAPPPG